jgi:hypothetical protein
MALNKRQIEIHYYQINFLDVYLFIFILIIHFSLKIWRKFMVPVLLIVYLIPLYSIGIFGIEVQPVPERDAQDRILSIYYREMNNVN